jgi:hypothetical protein
VTATGWPAAPAAAPVGSGTAGLAQDAVLDLLLPFWQVAIGICVLAAVVVVGFRLAARGPSRMNTGLILTGGAVAALCALGILLERI